MKEVVRPRVRPDSRAESEAQLQNAMIFAGHFPAHERPPPATGLSLCAVGADCLSSGNGVRAGERGSNVARLRDQEMHMATRMNLTEDPRGTGTGGPIGRGRNWWWTVAAVIVVVLLALWAAGRGNRRAAMNVPGQDTYDTAGRRSTGGPTTRPGDRTAPSQAPAPTTPNDDNTGNPNYPRNPNPDQPQQNQP
jgi:hypothetical protein